MFLIHCLEMDFDLFTIRICYGGFFKDHPTYHYSQVNSRYFNNYDKDRFSITEIKDMTNQLGYTNCTYFYYLIPRQTLQNGLTKLRCDADILKMLGSMRGADMVKVYVEHEAYASNVPSSKTGK